LSLFAAAQKVTKNAAAADKRLKINEQLSKRKELASQPACRQGRESMLKHLFFDNLI
jgi:hypothetical protein